MTAMPAIFLRRATLQTLLCASTLCAYAAPAAATIVTVGCLDATSCTLAELYGGASVFVNETRFFDWQVVEQDDALSAVDPAGVSVAFSQNGRRINLDFSTASFHSGPDGLEGNYAFAFRVQPKAGEPSDRLDKYSLDLLDYALGGLGTASARVKACLDPDPLDALCLPGFEVSAERLLGQETEQTHAEGGFDPKSALQVLTRVSVAGSPTSPLGDPPSASAEVGQFRQSFYRVPEPSALWLLTLAALVPHAIGMRRPARVRRPPL